MTLEAGMRDRKTMIEPLSARNSSVTTVRANRVHGDRRIISNDRRHNVRRRRDAATDIWLQVVRRKTGSVPIPPLIR